MGTDNDSLINIILMLVLRPPVDNISFHSGAIKCKYNRYSLSLIREFYFWPKQQYELVVLTRYRLAAHDFGVPAWHILPC